MMSSNAVTDSSAASLLRPSLYDAVRRWVSCLRLSEIGVLQGSPVLGIVFAYPEIQQASNLALVVVANVCLMAHVFLINDWSGLTADRLDPNKSASVFTTKGVTSREVGGLCVFTLAAALLIASRVGVVPLLLAAAIALLSALYSLPAFNWKAKPLLSSLTHLVGGIGHFLLGYSVLRPLDASAVMTAAFFALTFAAGHLTQELRDHDGDARSGTTTNAVTFGPRRAFLASLLLFTLAHLLLFVLSLSGSVPRPLGALVLLYPMHMYWSWQAVREDLTYVAVCRLQTRYRALYAFMGLAMVTAVVLQ